MESDDDFDAFSEELRSDLLGKLLAQWRRDAFIKMLERLPDVIEVIPSGSLARGTYIGPARDVDLIVVFDRSAHPDYGRDPKSAQAAMRYLENTLLEQLHPLSGTEALIKGTEQRTHVVKCHGGSIGPYTEFFPTAPPVDVMPAVRETPHLLQKSHLLVPELPGGGGGAGMWIDVDPETFMRQVEERQREWKYFTEVIKMVKAWAELNNLDMKTVAIEAMVLMYCPRPRLFETLSRSEAIARFFEAADKAGIKSLKDPAGRCGEIDPKMNFRKLRSQLKIAAGLARQAMNAECEWKNRFLLMQDATDPSVFWRKLFGKKYPAAREPYWRAPSWEPWFGKYQTKYATAPGPGGPGPKPPPSDPKTPPDDDPKTPPSDSPGGPGGPGPRNPDDLDPLGGPGRRTGRLSGSPGDTRRARPTRPRPSATNPSDAGRGQARAAGTGPATTPSPSPAGPSASGSGRRTGPAPAEPVTNMWTKVLGPPAVSVPLTFG